MKLFFFFIVLASVLFSRELPFPWVVYEDQIRYYLDGRSYEIDGKFYSYDFYNNGIDYYDWIYISKNGSAYRLFGVNPTSNNCFGWQEIELPKDFKTKGEFQGYFIYLNYPNDNDKRYSWIFVNKEKKLFKLLSRDLSWSFKWLPIPTDNLQISINDNNVTFSLLPIPTISLNDAEDTNYQDLEERDAHSLNNLFLGYQKAQGVWLNFFSQPLYYWKDYQKDPLQTLKKFKKEIDNYFSTPQSPQTTSYQLYNNGFLVIDNQNSFSRLRFPHSKPYPPEKFAVTKVYTRNNNIVVLTANDESLFFNLIDTYRGCIITLSGYLPETETSGSYRDQFLVDTKLELFCRIYKER